ncbi:hypothetical protein AAO66_09780 [Salmonella enterica subsp. enterica serovar Virchow]|uniref:Uncharacterized protein n=1 Tax=Salmonella virchow TaxID=48409 RepID=A0A5H9T4I3_SALVI|nr:hypothetical protein [Salmonella enterica]EBV7185876.1 hypothetical protein [Salmonella enterica subsp. enterica serovar Braenderup]EBG5517413.1 hypothetical protein [Salmonella enterica subsp. enterica serovar Virchow]EBR8590049.1 hypothetical protein [Salmonella enterica subsp. enterica serovar Virchow]EBS3191703.1 hypothetical protein [Salmonella enterica subsp. enterica serovar Virchow]EBX0729781.1 hypothetical protein [Salmonella enterica subsp. enterica serovar Virchow]
MEKCNRCIVGLIGSQPVLSGDWANAVENFEIVIADWNEKTKRFAVPYPGFARKFNYCPHCGNKVED